jgi:peptidoglycan/xylan/chitin deacetylase (PgdA/CDA1 family)
MLDAFSRQGIHATWATVGALFCTSKRELESMMPVRRPRYADRRLDPYDLTEIGNDETSDPFHYAPSLVERIARMPDQEIGTHTFSHFYCLEAGQDAEDFEADLNAARKASSKFGDDLMRSIVFPRNQLNREYWAVLSRTGIRAYRSNGTHWAYAASTYPEPLPKRAFRLVDAYVPLSRSRTMRARRDAHGLVDVPASAFLRPWSHELRRLDRLRFLRLTRAMTHAAREDGLFHLWWHPHNFGRNLMENMHFLQQLLDHFDRLRREAGMRSLTMLEAARVA